MAAVVVASSLLSVAFNRAINFLWDSSIKSRYKSLELEIINDTTHKLNWKDDDTHRYFDDGCFYSHPESSVIPPNGSTVAKVSNKRMHPTGVNGVVAFQIDDTTKYLVIGFRSSSIPFSSPEHVVTVITMRRERKPKEELDRVYKTICNDKAKDVFEDGFKIQSKLEVSSDCDRKIVITISE